MSENRSVFPTLIGNAHLRTILGSDILSGRLGHAYILEGVRGSGKHTAARLIAAALSCENRTDKGSALPCGHCLACRKIHEGISPDVIYIRREEDRATIGVEAIRTLREALWIAPNENDAKVYVIEEADTMTPQAQNAFLLSLEEPPPYVVFLLLTENASALLETIRSRAPILRMQLFDSDTLGELLKNTSRFETLSRTRPDLFAQAVAASDGALGQAKELLTAENASASAILALRADAMHITKLLFSPNAAESTEILRSLPKDREEVAELLKYVLLALRDLMAVKKSSEMPPLLYPSKTDCKLVSDKTSISRIIGTYDEVFRAREDILANASVQTVFVSLLLKKH